jgi:phosphate transport system protein
MRDDLDRALDTVRADLVEMGERADAMLGEAVAALVARDADRADRVPEADHAVDALYARVHDRVFETVARQAPVGRDLRTLTAFLHAGLHVERMADYACSVARAARRSGDLAPDPALLAQLGEMGRAAQEVCRTALRALATGDEDLARTTPVVDDAVDRLNLGIFHRLVEVAAADDGLLPWVAHMIGVARLLERYADHGVDIAEQVVFAATGRSEDLGDGPRSAD